jgi:hypothetical protein
MISKLERARQCGDSKLNGQPMPGYDRAFMMEWMMNLSVLAKFDSKMRRLRWK